ncbi:PAS domain S-box-containing protein [Cyclobacterium xiamenense]|uniref:histidine kinase n=1 Tax=Cyclobacterium xiamenense TaxID=1297121 RepID=A0A1H7AFX0_9BACT|nr:PAS domain S-box protein [Cyclobacterium xiamenense]SEJ64489.1 PAS domain S-box-containing protein [Cyclobacterium xiamenense]
MDNVHDYSTLFYFNPLPNWVYDKETFEIVDVNQSAIDHYGYSRQEFLSMTIRDLRPAEELPKLHASHEGVDDKKNPIYFGTFTHRKKGGERIRVDVNGHPVIFKGRQCLMVTCQDVTEKEKQLLELTDSEQKLKTASSIAKLGYWRQEVGSSVLNWSDEVYRIWGRKKGLFEATFKNFFETIHPADRDLFLKEEAAVFAGKETLDVCHRILLPNGNVKWVHELGRLNRDERGNPLLFEGTVQDITKQKLEEQQLRLLESVVTHTSDSIMITEATSEDGSGARIVYVNDAFTKMTGYTFGEIVGKSPRILQGPKSDWEAIQRLNEAVKSREFCEITTINYKKNGEQFWVSISISPVLDETGRVSHWIALEKDVTAVMNEQLQRDLLAKISVAFHEGADLQSALIEVCRLIAIYGDFSFCEVWIPGLQKKSLRLAANFAHDAAGKTFYDQSGKVTKMDVDEGLPGKVWSENKSVIWEKVGQNECFVRRQAAWHSGLSVVLGIPLRHRDAKVGVLVVGACEQLGSMEQHQPVLSMLQSFIGSEINRKGLEEELLHLFEALPDIICLTDFQGNFLKMNRSGCELLGYQEMEIRGSSFAQFIHPEDAGNTAEAFQNLKSQGGIFKVENRFLTKSGRVVWLNWYGNPHLTEQVIYASAKNVTEEKKLQELIVDASQLAKIGGWELDLAKQEGSDTMYWSPMVKEILEVPEDYNPSLSGGFEFYSADSKAKIRAAVDKLIEQGVEFDEELLLLTSTGKEKWVRCIGRSERTNGRCTKIFGSFQDIDGMKKTELRISEILGSISDGFYAVDADWNFTFFNKEAENLLNRRKEELLGKNFWEEFSPAIGTQMERIYRDVAAQGKAVSFEYQYPGDGSWYEINTYPSGGGISSYFKNIDEKRRAAEELQKAYREKINIIESIGDAFFTVDKQWTITYWNKEAERLMGRSRSSMLGRNLWKQYADLVATDFYVQCGAAMESSQNAAFEVFYPTLNTWLEVAVYPSIDGLSVYFKDITRRKNTAMQIVRANERFEKVTQATTDAIWDWDIENDLIFRGMGFEKFFGRNVQRNFKSAEFQQDCYHPDDLLRIKESLKASLADPTREKWQMEYRITHSSGEERTVIDKGMIIRNESGKAIRMVGALTDISERKKHEREVQELNQLLKQHVQELEVTNEQLEQFAFIASHDLQEPLRMISSFLNQIERKYGDQLDAKAHQYIHFATDGAKRMKRIILDLLEYSRAGKFADTPEPVNIHVLIEEYKVLRRKLLRDKEAVLTAESLPTISCYKAPLVQTFHCLLDNAINYSREGVPPRIDIRVSEKETHWEFGIADNGIGIDSQFFDKIFIIFQRLHNKEQYKGTGIGLSIVKKHVEFWGGKIWLESSPGVGSTFYFTVNKEFG